MMGWYNGGWVLGTMLTVLFVAAVIAIAVAVTWRPSDRTARTRRPDSTDVPWREAERELEMRFARGEIDTDTLARGRAALRDRSG